MGTYWELDVNIVRKHWEQEKKTKNLPPKDPKERNQVPPEPCHWLQDSQHHFQPGWIPPSEHYKLGVFIMLESLCYRSVFPLRCMDEDLEEIFTLSQMYNALTSKKSLDLGSQCAELYKWIILERVGAFCLLAWCDELYCRLLHAPESSVMSLYIRFASLTPLSWYYIGSK